ncbi:MAG: 4'-phosphopantetheinyl transferase superfamily protein [Verrucomicrobia bacterium]|nr:4'-phosphopantetheinyl transferase superfamily protein [Verrucomicrobiota bacterium]
MNLAHPASTQTQYQRIELSYGEDRYVAHLVSLAKPAYDSLKSEQAQWLHPEELAYVKQLGVSEIRKRSYLLGRVAAKSALNQYLGLEKLTDFRILPGILMDPIVYHPMAVPWQVSITHSNTMACSVAFPSKLPMAIDLEDHCPKNAKAIQSKCTHGEMVMIRELGFSAEQAWTVLWTAKEALSKAIRTGLTCPFHLFEVKAVRRFSEEIITGEFQYFDQYQFRTWLVGRHFLSLIFPVGTQLDLKTSQ